MALKVYQVDAFADRAFAGNPAAVLILPGPANEAWMQAVAMEMNLSETAFVQRSASGFVLRWFTPTVEVDLCGHATLAAAHVLWETGNLPIDDPAVFHTRSGVLVASNGHGEIQLDFPRNEDAPVPAPPGLSEALGATPLYVGRNSSDMIVELGSEAEVRDLTPDLVRIGRLPCQGLIVTSRPASCDVDFVSRFFAPGLGVPEDPVTGSAHCCLGPFWARRLGRLSLRGRQVSPRGGTVSVRVERDRVILGGLAITVLVGELLPAALIGADPKSIL